MAEQQALVRDTWCEACSKPDLGLVDPVEYEEHGVIYVAGNCSICRAPVTTFVSEIRSLSAEEQLKPYALVRILKLVEQDSAYDSWKVNQRSPAIGDVGTLLDVLKANSAPVKYVVECSSQDGQTIWLSDFFAEEIEVVPQ